LETLANGRFAHAGECHLIEPQFWHDLSNLPRVAAYWELVLLAAGCRAERFDPPRGDWGLRTL